MGNPPLINYHGTSTWVRYRFRKPGNLWKHPETLDDRFGNGQRIENFYEMTRNLFSIIHLLQLLAFLRIGKSGLLQELANSQPSDEQSSNDSKQLILNLYEALSARPRHVSTVHKLVAPDLEWWFHGPPAHQYLLKLLTGQEDRVDFDFVPQSVAAFGSTVLVEGCDPERRISWVHAWTVADGIVTQVREYFNTSVTVTRFGNPSSAGSGLAKRSIHCPSVWESSCSELVGKSVPGLVLAI
ncbi:hypothetical protein QQ045_032283 [Rhodiola kirilowii]